jgi:tryptophan halogenase
MTARKRRVVIVGRDAALWLTAAAVRQALGPTGIEVTAIELPSALGPASAYATLPAIEALHSKLGLDEAQLLQKTGGSFSLGWNINGPGRKPFFIAHGSYGAPIQGNDFFAYWLKARRFGLDVAFEDFSPTAMAARHGRVLLPDEDLERFGRSDYAYHLPAIAYASLLKSCSQKLGVLIHHTVEIDVERDPATGLIGAVAPRGNAAIKGDLFIDASGSQRILAAQSGMEDWSAFFTMDRRLVARGEPFRSLPTYAELRRAETSWTALLASQAATHVVHAFVGADGADEESLEKASAAAGMALKDAVIERIGVGIRNEAWAANCVAIGRSACELDPLFDLDLHVIQLGVVHLLSLFPAAIVIGAERAEYNRITRSAFERLRDFQAALYTLAYQAKNAPATLHQKLAVFRARGAIAPMEDETFNPNQWRALLIGLGLLPETWPPAIDSTTPDQMKDGFRRILAFVGAKVREQPTHDRYLAEIGGKQSL